eukprot:6203225-Pleurochrysis_carterae.AAC.1
MKYEEHTSYESRMRMARTHAFECAHALCYQNRQVKSSVAEHESSVLYAHESSVLYAHESSVMFAHESSVLYELAEGHDGRYGSTA